MTVRELYDYKLKKYKEEGKRDDLDRLLALLMLNEKDNYEPFTCSSGPFYERYKEQINKNVSKVEKDFDITKDMIEGIIEEKGIFSNDYENDKIWFVFYEGFGSMQWGINYHKEKTAEEIYVLCFGDDKDIRLLNPLNEEFNYYDFITLFVTNLKLKGEEVLRYNELKEKLIKYYNDDKYKSLFGNFKLVKENDKEVFDIDMMIHMAIHSNLLSLYDRIEGYSKEINLKDEDSYNIVYKYKGKYQILMDELTDDYLVGIYEKEINEFIKAKGLIKM